MRRAGLGDFDLELPPYVERPKPPETPNEHVAYLLGLANTHDPGHPLGQAQFLESAAKMHLEQGRTRIAVAVFDAADRLYAQAMKGRSLPMERWHFLGRTITTLREYGQGVVAQQFQERQTRLEQRR